MITAFGTALLDSIHGPMRSYRITKVGGQPLTLCCDEYIDLRPDEAAILDSIPLTGSSRVLDFGCGTGRHLKHLRQRQPGISCCGIEHCDLLREHCAASAGPDDRFVPSLDAVPSSHTFDLILLMGNGLGILGNEASCRTQFPRLIDRLAPGGTLLLESGNFWRDGYSAPLFSIAYGALTDGPFPWGFASEAWLTHLCTSQGCSVSFSTSNAPGEVFFFATLQHR